MQLLYNNNRENATLIDCSHSSKKVETTVFENRTKSLIQHCERSELRFHFQSTKVNWKSQKWSILATFWKPDACGQTVLPDRLPYWTSQCLKITQKCRIRILSFSTIFVLLKVTCLVTLFDRKHQVFKNSPRLTFFGIFDELLST